MIRLRVLGSIELENSDGSELRAILAQPKRFALLVYLASTPRVFHRRDTLLALFWPELDDARGRTSLNSAIRFLRKALGGPSDSVVVSRGGGELGIDSTKLWCDAAAFRDEIKADRRGEALELYRGDFLHGFFSDRPAGFEEWMERERGWLRAQAAQAARGLAEARERDENFTTAVSTARRAVELSDADERVVRELLELLDRLGDRSGAIHAYEAFAGRLANEFDAKPSAETMAVIERIRARSQTNADALGAAGAAARSVEPNAATAPLAKLAPPIAAPGAELNGWQVVRTLGHGGMATVYLARDLKHERHVALKTLRPESLLSGGGERFLREIQITASLAHPHILPLIDSGAAEGALYLVTPYVAGESLRVRLRREPRLPLIDALRIATEVSEALDYAHRCGIIHRDIKPENILLADGHAVVADFGVARALAVSGVATRIPDSDPGAVVGSRSYMSPEQAGANADVGPRTDLYALGCVLFEMLTGELAAGGESPRAVLSRRADVSPTIARLVSDCIAKKPERRPRSAADVLRTLGNVR